MKLSGTNCNNDLYKAGLKNYNFPNINVVFRRETWIVVATSILLILFGSSARGEFFLFAFMLWKNWDQFNFFSKTKRFENAFPDVDLSSSNNASEQLSESKINPSMNAIDDFLKDYNLQYFYIHVGAGLFFSYLMFLSIGGYLQWRYYIKKREKPEEWKCQPKRFLSAQNERHEFLLGCGCLLVAGTVSGLASTYIDNGGEKSKVYFDVNEYGWAYFIFSTIALFLLQDGSSYYYHRMLHLPFFYKNFHKWHHRYHSPTAFSAVAMHPLESTIFQLILLSPVFILPIHFLSVVGCFYYMYYFGLIDHSGIDMNSIWPWQPPVRFHDDHHKYFHVNFGFNTLIFDRFHGTLRRKDRKYGEKIFYGKGAPIGGKTV